VNLVHALSKSSLRWTLQSADVPRPRGSGLVPGMILTVVPEPGAAPLTRQFYSSDEVTLHQMLVLLLKEQLPAHPVLRQWLGSKGNALVELEPHALDNISEYMHTALRKLGDGPQSTLNWNALHALHPLDRQALWATARRVVAVAFEKSARVNRRDLAIELRDQVIETLDECREGGAGKSGDKAFTRTELQDFSLRALYAGCRLTELDEWVWTWLGYVVKDAAPASAEA